jgi:cellulose synthase/poly-beta-1,6-N-acetylglucosamine synthase-like glycosyltransferase
MVANRAPGSDAHGPVPVDASSAASANSVVAEGQPANLAISVCLPMYNNSTTIARCLRSILDQDGVEFEVVVVDDDSSDDSVAIATGMLRSGDRLIRNGSRLGLNGNHNKCLELAHGECIQFVHGDDWLLPGALQTLARCFTNPLVGLAFAPRRILNADVPWWRVRRRARPVHVYFPKLREHNHGPSLVAQMALVGAGSNWVGEPTCVMFRRRLALATGGFRDDIQQLVDLDLWFRLMLRSEVSFVPHELSVRSHTAATESIRNLTTRSNWLDHLRILTWMIVDPASTIGIRMIAALWWLVTWLTLPVKVAASGPERWSRLKTFAQAPVSEFALARRLRDGLS